MTDCMVKVRVDLRLRERERERERKLKVKKRRTHQATAIHPSDTAGTLVASR